MNKTALSSVAALAMLLPQSGSDDAWVVFPAQDGPGKDKHIVFVTGDDEYRSEEGMPQLAKILSTRCGRDDRSKLATYWRFMISA